MQKYFENLDDYTDTRPSRLMEITKRIIPALIFAGSLFLMFAVCGVLEAL
ncbi:hypothetical protein AALB39_29180 [Lachnospiraceae bacterium 54-53]